MKILCIQDDHGHTVSNGLSNPVLLICHIKIIGLFRCPVFSVPKDLKKIKMTLSDIIGLTKFNRSKLTGGHS